MKTNTTSVIVLATSKRGAKLVTDGEKRAWVMGHQVREDGTLTAGGAKTLAESTQEYEMTSLEQATMVADALNGSLTAMIKLEANMRAEKAEAERIKKEEAKKRANADVTVNILRENWKGEHGQAWKVKTVNTTCLYGKIVSVYTYLPKCKVTVVPQPDGSMNITMPAWLIWKNRNMIYTEVA